MLYREDNVCIYCILFEIIKKFMVSKNENYS